MAATEAKTGEIPDLAANAVLMESTDMPEGTPVCKGFDFNSPVNFEKMMEAYKYMGFQGTNLGLAVDRINEMVRAPYVCGVLWGVAVGFIASVMRLIALETEWVWVWFRGGVVAGCGCVVLSPCSRSADSRLSTAQLAPV